MTMKAPGSAVAVGIALLGLGAGAQDEDARTVEGTLSQGGVSMTIVDAFAVCDPNVNGEREVNVYLFPFKIKEEDVKDLQKGKETVVTARHGSPDKSKWKSCPFGRLIIRLKPGKEGRKAITGFSYVTLHLYRYGQTVNRQVSVKEEKLKTWEFQWDESKGSGRIELRSVESVDASIESNKCNWDVKLACDVVTLVK